jgi:type IV pilus assembly protein PilE
LDQTALNKKESDRMNMPLQIRRPNQRGFTLIELMIAVAIIGILLRLAVPAYLNSIKKTRRTDAKTALLDLAQREERYLSTANIYTTSAPVLGYSSGTVTASAPMSVLSGGAAYYQMSVVVPDPNGSTSSPSFAATAVRIGSQTSDTLCGDYTITNTGKQTVANASNSPADCW